MPTMNVKDAVVITGASSGIGLACAKAFAAQGMPLILLARRLDRLKDLERLLRRDFNVEILIGQLDVRHRHEVCGFFENLTGSWRNIAVLVNNAGLSLTTDKLQIGNLDCFDQMIDTNVKGLLYVTRSILPLMIPRNKGHIINIGSIAGHDCYPGGNVYSATKHAVRALTKSLSLDLLGTNIRVTSIDPGAVETEFSIVRWQDEDRAKDFYKDFNPLLAHDIAEAVLWSAMRPPHVNIHEMTLMPTDQRSVNFIHRGGRNLRVGVELT